MTLTADGPFILASGDTPYSFRGLKTPREIDAIETALGGIIASLRACYCSPELRDRLERARHALRGEASIPTPVPASFVAALRAAVDYDAAIRSCANDSRKMSSFCSAAGEDLDTLYDAWITKSRACLDILAPAIAASEEATPAAPSLRVINVEKIRARLMPLLTAPVVITIGSDHGRSARFRVASIAEFDAIAALSLADLDAGMVSAGVHGALMHVVLSSGQSFMEDVTMPRKEGAR